MKELEERMAVSANQEVTMLERLNEYAILRRCSHISFAHLFFFLQSH